MMGCIETLDTMEADNFETCAWGGESLRNVEPELNCCAHNYQSIPI
jgi:hypothetical protein